MNVGSERDVTKIALALVRDDHLLLVRRHGNDSLILPGGKPERGENPVQTLEREIREELSCRLVTSSVQFFEEFVDELADDPRRSVRVLLFVGRIDGTIRPAAEIREAVWHPLDDVVEETLAPSLRRQILPTLAYCHRLMSEIDDLPENSAVRRLMTRLFREVGYTAP
jgi:8-oxo-dGTP diphosphatase